MVTLGGERPDVVAITAAMLQPVGPGPVRRALPDRVFDVGIAEQHATTVGGRAGPGRPAPGGRRLRDVPQPGLRPGADGRRAAQAPASRSSSTGPASPATTAPATTACGTCRSCRSSRASGSPLRATRPRCATSCARRSTVDDAPTVVRFPKGAVADDLPAIDRVGGLDVLVRERRRGRARSSPSARWRTAALEVAERLRAQGIGVTVVDPRWVTPGRPGARPDRRTAPAGRHAWRTTAASAGWAA